MLFGGDIAKHGAAVPADHRRADGAGDVVVRRSDVGGERPEGVKRSLVAPLQLLRHVFLNHVHGNMARPLVHHLHPAVPGAPGKFSLRLKFAKLGLVVGVGDGAWTQAIADGKADVIGSHEFANLVPVGVEETLLVMSQAPFGHDRAAA